MTVEYRVRSRRTRWTRKFPTLAAAQHYAQTDWAFKDDPTVYIEKISVDTLAKI
jgi:hypothetical protein